MFKCWNPFRRFKKQQDAVSKEEVAAIFRVKYTNFKELLDSNGELAKIIADISEKLHGNHLFGMSYIRSQAALAVFHTLRMVKSLNVLSGDRHASLYNVLDDIHARIREELHEKKEAPLEALVLPHTAIDHDMVDWVGGKNANLGEVLNGVGLPIPEGFAITTRAFELFLTANDLVDQINKQKMELDPMNPVSIQETSEVIQRLILTATVPRQIEEAIFEAYDSLKAQLQKGTMDSRELWIAMRSSAVGEDSELSFAGQYVSVLNVPREKLVSTYKVIAASLYTPRAITYRFNKGIRDEDVSMSVACLRMIESVASGVMYSRHPFHPMKDHVIITAVWGLGPYAVDGVITPDTYHVAKDEDQTILEMRISRKPVQLVRNPDGGLMEVPVPHEKTVAPCLAPDQMRTLAQYAQRLEDHYGGPQDTEWTLDQDGRLLVLQTRPLHLKHDAKGSPEEIVPDDTAPVLVEGGAVACPGIGFGKAYHVRSEDDLAGFPDGGVLIARHSAPQYVVVMPKAAAIVTDTGSVTGHMASLAREFEIPSILDAQTATSSIPDGMEITVDAWSCRVYKGRVTSLLDKVSQRQPYMKGTPVHDTLQRVAKWVMPLHLVNPKAPNFNPQACESLHDIMRYVHELSYSEMFKISDIVSNGKGAALRLISPIPLDLYVIDLGGGLIDVSPRARKVTVDRVVSIPFSALLRGMLHKDLLYREPRPVEFGGFLSVMSEQMFSPNLGAERFGDRSYAIVSDTYLNFSSRVGYHYSVLDSYCSDSVNKNYITFSFTGGAADEVRRGRRARAIAEVLRELDFLVEVIADRVTARFQKYERSLTEDRLDTLGRLLQFTRQMDMIMNSEGSVQALARQFLEGNYKLE